MTDALDTLARRLVEVLAERDHARARFDDLNRAFEKMRGELVQAQAEIGDLKERLTYAQARGEKDTEGGPGECRATDATAPVVAGSTPAASTNPALSAVEALVAAARRLDAWNGRNDPLTLREAQERVRICLYAIPDALSRLRADAELGDKLAKRRPTELEVRDWLKATGREVRW